MAALVWLLAFPASGAKFTVAVIPDTLHYCDSADATSSPQPASVEIFQRQIQYLVSQKTALNLVFATHLGDVVARGDLSDAEWQNAKSATDLLAASGLPFGMSPGEHDYDNYSHAAPGNRPVNGDIKWTQYFGSTSPYFTGKSWYGGVSPSGLSSFQTFTAGGKTCLHLSLELEPPDDTITWATSVITNHPGAPTMVSVHEYLSYLNDTNGQALYLDDAFRSGQPYNNSQAVWNKLIAPNDQVFLVLCGHSASNPTNGVSNGENLRTDLNAAGHPVYQVLSDYEGNTVNADGTVGTLAGGAGWLRLLTFDTMAGTIHFQTFSTEMNENAGVPAGSTFNLPSGVSDFTLPIPDRVFGPPARWSFGMLADSQWTVADDGKNPNSIPADMLRAMHQQFIQHGVSLVLGLGDLADYCSPTNVYARALYVQDLYNAGIGFYPTRGNHESGFLPTWATGAAFRYLYPQIVPSPNPGFHNTTPPDVTTALISPVADLANAQPASRAGSAFAVGINCSAPDAVNAANDSVSYAFDYHNATFMLLDQFRSPDATTSYLSQQQGWIQSRLSGRPPYTHAFVCSHKDLLGGDHKDNLFGGPIDATDPGDGIGMNFGALASANQAALMAKTNTMNAFLGSMQSNHVSYYLCGHDHTHYASVVTSPDGQSRMHQLICAPASSKFYAPVLPSSTNEVPIEQEGGRVGYYIVTVNGPQVTFDYYAEATVGNYSGPFNFLKRSSAGYSLNGREFIIAEGGAYTGVTDTTAKAVANGESGYLGTTLQLLAGTNLSRAVGAYNYTNYVRPLSRAFNTGWAPALPGNFSDTLTFWGHFDVGATQSDTMTVSLSYNPGGVTDAQASGGWFCLATTDAHGNWINAVDANVGGVRVFVNGPWKAGYGLGTYGVDATTHTAWAVVNHASVFAVVQLPPHLAMSGPDLLSQVSLYWPASQAPGYVLQSCSSLTASNWVTLGNLGEYSLTVSTQGFFRLLRSR